MAEPTAKRQKTDVAAEVCGYGGCDDLENAARACCLACLQKFVNVEPPLHKEVIEYAVKHVADRSSWCCKAKRELDCCGTVDMLLTAAAAAAVDAEDTSYKPDLSREIVKACTVGCLHCTVALLKYQDSHLGDRK
jgi:hypothetical protein